MPSEKKPPSTFTESQYVVTVNDIRTFKVEISHKTVLDRMQVSEVFDQERIAALQLTANTDDAIITTPIESADDNTKGAVELLLQVLQAKKNGIPSTHLQHAKQLLGDQGVAKLINPKLFEFLTKDEDGKPLTINDDCNDQTRSTIFSIGNVENAYQGLHEALQEYLTNSPPDENAVDKLHEKEETLQQSIQSLYTDQTNSSLECSHQLSVDLARFLERDRAEALLSLLQPFEDKLPKWNPWAELPRLELKKASIANAHEEWPAINGAPSASPDGKLSFTIGTTKHFTLPDLNHLSQKEVMGILLAFQDEHKDNCNVKVKIWQENGIMKFCATDTTPNNGGQILKALYDKFKNKGQTLAAHTGGDDHNLSAETETAAAAAAASAPTPGRT